VAGRDKESGADLDKIRVGGTKKEPYWALLIF